MNRITIAKLTGSAALLALAVVACGDDDDSPTDSGSTGGTTGGSTGGAGTGGNATGTGGNATGTGGNATGTGGNATGTGGNATGTGGAGNPFQNVDCTNTTDVCAQTVCALQGNYDQLVAACASAPATPGCDQYPGCVTDLIACVDAACPGDTPDAAALTTCNSQYSTCLSNAGT